MIPAGGITEVSGRASERKTLTLSKGLLVLSLGLIASLALVFVIDIGLQLSLTFWKVLAHNTNYDDAWEQVAQWMDNQWLREQLLFSLWALLAIIWVRWELHMSLAVLGLKKERMMAHVINGAAWGVIVKLLILGVCCISALVSTWVFKLRPADVQEYFKASPYVVQSVKLMSLSSLYILVTAPVSEEILFRGVLYSAMRSRYPTLVSLIISNVVFTAAHLQLKLAPVHFIVGVAATCLFEKRKSLIAPISFHITANAMTFLATLLT
jgi:membrane protease YdiL (CAAX protease family)